MDLRQRFGNRDDLVSVPVLDVSSASENTTQTCSKNKHFLRITVAAPDSYSESLRTSVKMRLLRYKLAATNRGVILSPHSIRDMKNVIRQSWSGCKGRTPSPDQLLLVVEEWKDAASRKQEAETLECETWLDCGDFPIWRMSFRSEVPSGARRPIEARIFGLTRVSPRSALPR